MRELCVFHYRWGFSEIVQPNVAHCKHRDLVVPNPAIEIFTGFCTIQKKRSTRLNLVSPEALHPWNAA